MSAIDEARVSYDILSILGTSKRKMVCPLPSHVHHNNTPSFSVFWRAGVQYWKCHGSCNREGDVVDLVGELRVPNYSRHNSDHVRQALALLSDRFQAAPPKVENEVLLGGGEWRSFLPPSGEVMAYSKSRGLTEETMVRFRIGSWKQFMTMPNFENGKLMGIKLRRIVEGEPRFFSLKGSRLGLFNLDAVYLSTFPVLVAKGEIPCMLMDQLNFKACAPTGGEGSWYKNEAWRTALALCPKIIVGDNDEPGRVMAQRRASLLGGIIRFPPERFKDWDEWWLAEPNAAVEATRQWLQEGKEEWMK